MKKTFTSFFFALTAIVCSAQEVNLITNGDFETTPFNAESNYSKNYLKDNFVANTWVCTGNSKYTNTTFTAETDSEDPLHNNYIKAQLAGQTNPSWYGPLIGIHVSLSTPVEKGHYILSFDAKSSTTGYQVATQIADYLNAKEDTKTGVEGHSLYILRGDIDVYDEDNSGQSAAICPAKGGAPDQWTTLSTEFDFSKTANKYASIGNAALPLEVKDAQDAILKDFIVIFQLKQVEGDLCIDNVKLTKKVETAISQPTQSAFSIAVSNQTVSVMGGNTQEILVHNLAGNLVMRTYSTNFTLPQSGVYFVSCGNQVEKVLIR